MLIIFFVHYLIEIETKLKSYQQLKMIAGQRS